MKTIIFIMIIILFYACSSSTEGSGSNDAGIRFKVTDENNKPLNDVAVHLYIDFGMWPGQTAKAVETGIRLIKSNPPDEVELRQNYPNPMEGQTSIFFSIPSTEQVKLEILFKNEANPLRVLIDDTLKAGYYKFQWDGTNDREEHLTNNIYWYRLTAGEVVLQKELCINISDAGYIQHLQCKPLVSTNNKGVAFVDTLFLPIGKTVVWMDESGNELGRLEVPEKLGFIFIKNGYDAETAEIDVTPLPTGEKQIVLRRRAG